MGSVMNKFIVSVAAISALASGSAMAADLPARMPVKAPAAVVAYNWSGFYTASSIGAGWQEVDGVVVLPPPDRHHTEKTKAWTGSHVGIQGQWGNWVLGIEGSYNTPLSSSFASSLSGPDCINITGTANRSCDARITDILTAGGKLGYSFGNWMLYGTGGYANGRIEQRVTNTLTGVNFGGATERHGGWYAGGGIDMYVTRFLWSDLILGVEYKHIELDNKLHLDSSGLAISDKTFDAAVDMIMAKATFKWVGMGPLTMFAGR